MAQEASGIAQTGPQDGLLRPPKEILWYRISNIVWPQEASGIAQRGPQDGLLRPQKEFLWHRSSNVWPKRPPGFPKEGIEKELYDSLSHLSESAPL